MRRFSSASFAALTAVLLFTAFWSACGGGSSSSSSTFSIASFVFSPTTISLEPGQVLNVTATPYNSSGSIVSATITYSVSAADQQSGGISISPGGSLCAGSWDGTFTLCSVPKIPVVGAYKVTATANGATGTATAYVHYHVDAVYLHAPTAVCTSSGTTAGVTPYACTANPSAVASCASTCVDNASMCDVTSSVGAFDYGIVDSSVASIDTTGKLTAGIPGNTKLYASVTSGGANSSVSTAVPYTTCLVDSISLNDAGNSSFTLATAGTSTLTATAVDTAGKTISPTLTYNNLQAAVGTVSGSTSTGTYTGKAPGYGGVVASCTAPSCNVNASAVFSNVVTSTVQSSASTGAITANETNVYVTGIGAIQLYPVDTTKFTVGTVASLPSTPNSIAMARDGLHIYLGSDTNAMVVTTASNSVQSLSFPGKILAVAPNNAYVIFASSAATNNVFIMSGSSTTIANSGGFTIPGVTAASFTPDGNTVYFAAGSKLYRYRIIGDSGSTPAPLALTGGGAPLSSAPADVKTSANGTILFSALSSSIPSDETCNALVNNQYVTTFQSLPNGVGFGASALAALPSGAGMLAVNGSNVEQIDITTPNPLTAPFVGCPATPFAVTATPFSLSALGSGFTVNQLIVSNSGHYAAVLANCTSASCNAQVGIIDLTKGTVTPVPFVNKGTGTIHQAFSGAFLLDDSGLWVGADDATTNPLGTIHFIDVTKLADTQQVNVPIQGLSSGSTPKYVNPSLVVVQPK